MDKVIVSKINESYVEVNATEDILHELYGRYSEYQSGYQFNPKFKCRIWDGKIHLFNIRTGLLPSGLLIDCLQFCKTRGYEIELKGIDVSELKEDLDDNWYKYTIEQNMKNTNLEIRDYQDDAIRKALTFKKGILLSCTSSGKSLMLYNIIKCLRKKGFRKILLIVPNINLVNQMHKDFSDYGYENFEEVERLGGGHKNSESEKVLISTWESLQYKENEYFEDFDACFCDECHGSKAKKMMQILKLCNNARVKIGTTGTLPTDKADLLMIKSVLGNVIFELKSKELIDKGVLTTIQIANIKLKYPLEFVMNNKGRSYPEEVKMVEEYSGRNKVLKFILDNSPKEHNMLILVNHIKHLEDVKTWINQQYPERKVAIINGGVKGSEREEIRVSIENENGTILLGTYATMSTGVNIPKLHDVILFANSKSKIKVLQSIGRGLRKHSTKNQIILYDIVDDLTYYTRTKRPVHNYLMKHWLERLSYYKEQEFPTITTEINI